MNNIFLGELHIEDCRGCMLCFQEGESSCPCRDDLNDLKKRLFSADGLIVTSPVYAYQVTAQLKRFIDRMSYLLGSTG
ncbi:flavodoxin family protein [Sinanaerobacter sp. ZZT-01]|uniref:flavodoxin family protein n=1 Tax=Sinanaerobacter sp. ZZT-01 TaxID=3111540 RepID=UPI002D76CF46|nr:flavodoxin family protein [Sinanaerobacter sp. ZZT-01]WRR95060.1 flavodoxin family protein [Sinanaerobacter sp. ZZT-01]